MISSRPPRRKACITIKRRLWLRKQPVNRKQVGLTSANPTAPQSRRDRALKRILLPVPATTFQRLILITCRRWPASTLTLSPASVTLTTTTDSLASGSDSDSQYNVKRNDTLPGLSTHIHSHESAYVLHRTDTEQLLKDMSRSESTEFVADPNPTKGNVLNGASSTISPRSRKRRRRSLSMTGETEIAPGVYITASCRKQWHMWNTCESTGSLTQIADNFEHFPAAPNAMVRESNTILPSEMQGDLIGDVEEDSDLLQQYYSRPDSNIVLESICPAISPHIVITLARDTAEDYHVPFYNRVDPQWSGWLMVPPYDLSQRSSDNYTISEHFLSGFNNPLTPCLPEPLPVFSGKKFNSFISKTFCERKTRHSIVSVLQKLQVKAAVMTAASSAHSFRSLYNNFGYPYYSERPFCWTDPAVPVMLASKMISGAVFIESDNPFSIPHIMINSPPPQDPYVYWMNGTTDPQDAGFGKYLTVPLRHVNYVNQTCEYDCPYDQNSPEPPVNEDDSLSETDSASFPRTPLTSTCTVEFDSYMDDYCTTGSELYDSLLIEEDMSITDDVFEFPKFSDTWSHGPVEGVNIITSDIDDSDDDDLPPFDEWYQSIASRTVL